MDDRELRITIKMMITQAQTALKQVDEAIDKTSKTGRNFGTVMKTIGAGVIGFGKSVIGILTSLKALVAALAGIIALRAVISVFQGMANEMDRTAKLAKELNVDVSLLSGLLETVGFSGGSAEQLTMALRKLNTQIGMAANGGAEAAKVFKELRIQLREGGNIRATDDVLLDVADKLARIPDTAERARVAARLFGEEAGPRLLNFLTQGREGLEALRKEAEFFGVVLTGKAAKAAEEYQNSLKRFQLSIKGVRMALTEELLPAVTVALNGLATFIASNREFIVDTVKRVVNAVLKVVEYAGNVVLGIVEEIANGQIPEAFRLAGELVIAVVVRVAAVIRRELTQALIEVLAPLVKMGTSLKYIGIEAGTVGKVLNELAHATDSANASIGKSDKKISDVVDALQRLASSGGFTTLKDLLGLLIVALNQTSEETVQLTRNMTLLERAMRGVKNAASALTNGFKDAFTDFKTSFTDLSQLTAQVQSQVSGAFSSMQGAAAGFFETIYKGGKAKDALKEFVASMISSLISLAAQLTVIIGLALLFNVLTGGSLAVSGLATTGAALSGAGGLAGGIFGMMGGSSGGSESGGQTLANTGSKSVPRSIPQFNVAAPGGGTTIVNNINALDSKSFLQFMNKPENASGVTKLVTYRQRTSIHGAR